jgi:hypothetical protein
MNVEIIDGFKFEKVGNRILNLLVESNRMEETISYVNKKSISGISLNCRYGYFLRDTDFLKDISSVVEKINIVDDTIDLSGLIFCANLKELFVGGNNKSPIDFACFKKLEYCNVFWHKGLVNLSECLSLKELYIRKYRVFGKLNSGFPCPKNIEVLGLTQANIDNVDFIKDLKYVRRIELNYIRSKFCINGLAFARNSIQELVIDHCKNFDSYEVIGGLHELRYLSIFSSKDIITLSFLKLLKRLEHFSFVDTCVIDGDLSNAIGIKYVGFLDKKHYSHTFKEINR